MTFNRGGYETILVILIAVISTFLVSGLPFGRLSTLTAPGDIIQQTTVVPKPNTKNALNMDALEIQTTFSASGSCTPPTSSDIASSIQDQYHVTILSDYVSDSTVFPQQLRLAYKTLCLLERSKTFSSLIQDPNPAIKTAVYFRNNSGSCGTGITGLHNGPGNACEQTGKATNVHCSTVDWCDKTYEKGLYANMFVMTHELGHIAGNLSAGSAIRTSFSNQFLPSAFSPLPLPTRNCTDAVKNKLSTLDECFSDMIGEYLTYTHYEHDDSIFRPNTTFTQYTTTYQPVYNFAKTNIFDGIEYKAADIDLSTL